MAKFPFTVIDLSITFFITAILFTDSVVQAASTVAYRSSSASTYAARTNLTLTAPAGIQNNDILIILFFIAEYSNNPPVPTPPAGFALLPGFTPTQVSDVTDFRLKSYAWYKVANNESGNYTITHANDSSVGSIGAYSGANTTTPISPNVTQASGTGTTAPVPSLTTVGNNSLVIYWSQDWGDTANSLSAPAGTTPTFTTRHDGSGNLLYVADGVLATAGATGIKTHTINNGAGNHPWQAGLIAIQPATCLVQSTADSHRVPGGGGICWAITGPNAVCKEVINSHASGLDILVPTKTTTEWTTFYGNLPSGVTATACP